jgi:23S rRNA (guanosine2251-2'-O)-methyltransferase
MANRKYSQPRRPRPVTKHDPRSAGPPGEGHRPLNSGRTGKPPARVDLGQQSAAPVERGATYGHELIYGRNPVLEALRGRRHVYRLWLATDGHSAGHGQGHSGEKSAGLQEDLRLAAASAGRQLPPLSLVPTERLDVLSGSPEHQGVVAEVDLFAYRDPADILAERDLVLALDRVQDPHNLGAIIRTAEAAGAAVVIPRHRAVAVTPAVVKASAGATEHVDIAQVRNLSDFLADAKRAEFWVYGAAAGAEQVYDAPDYRGRVVLVLGSEGEGLGRRVEEACDQLISIPLGGRVSSLNVSVSAGILLYEAVRQRRAVP